MKVTAKATRSGEWWAVEVPEFPGAFTQAKRLDQVADVAAAAVADLAGVDVSEVEVVLEPVLDADVMAVVYGAREAADEAVAVQAKASTAMREAVATLRASQLLTTRDAAVLLGISHQRVAQLSGTTTETKEQAIEVGRAMASGRESVVRGDGGRIEKVRRRDIKPKGSSARTS